MKIFLLLISFVSLIAFAQMHDHKMFQSVPEDKAVLLQKGKEARYCVECGMDLVKFYKTSHAAKVDGKQKQFCSIHCLATAMKSDAKISDIKVVDTKTLKWIDAKKAHYVVGSNIKGTMSRVSKYAFANLDDAKAFAKKHGGKILNFNQAFKMALKE